MSCACATSSTCVISMSLCKICQLSLFVNLSYQLPHSILTVSFLSDCLISLTYDGLRLLSISVCGQLTFMSACPVTHDIRRLFIQSRPTSTYPIKGLLESNRIMQCRHCTNRMTYIRTAVTKGWHFKAIVNQLEPVSSTARPLLERRFTSEIHN